MSSKAVGIVRAHCRDCGWDYERSLEAGENLTVEQNRDIAQRVIRNHEYTCKRDDPRFSWGDLANVDQTLEINRGETDGE